MNTRFSVLFYPRGNDVDANGNAPIYLRITVNGKRSELSIKRKVLLKKWNSEAGKIRGTTSDVRELNNYMDSIKVKINKIQQTLFDNNDLITSQIIKNAYLGKNARHKMVLEIFQSHNNKVEKLVGKEFAAGTLERYKTAKNHVADYIKLEYNLKDIPVKDVNHEFISGLEYYIKKNKTPTAFAVFSSSIYFTSIAKIIPLGLGLRA